MERDAGGARRRRAAACAGIALAAVLGAAGPRPAGAETAGRLLACLQERYRGVSDVAARFTQVSRVATLGRARTRTGTMVFAAPGRMRWDYDPPDPQLIVADGKTLWLYRPERRQVVARPLDAAFARQTPLLFLLGRGDLGEEFTWPAGEVAPGAAGTAAVALTPRAPSPDLARLVLEVEPGSCRLAGTVIEDAFGNVTSLAFTDERRDAGADPERFRFTPPAGVEVLRP